ncbi:MAG: MATE family efflux transporter, partial [Chloroflexota bacterium]|nr:MATE family efflux transporter [Chloroflexota bacterium]
MAKKSSRNRSASLSGLTTRSRKHTRPLPNAQSGKPPQQALATVQAKSNTTKQQFEAAASNNRATDTSATSVTSVTSDTKENVTSVPMVTPGAPEAAPDPLPIPIAESSAPLSQTETQPGERSHIVRSATLVSIGNFGSSLIGMVRQSVVGALGTDIAGPFNAALSSAQTFNDFLVNGSVNGALIPTFNDFAEPQKRAELRRLVFTMVNLALIIMITATVIFMFAAPWFLFTILHLGFKGNGNTLTLQYARIVFCSLIALGPFAVLQAALFARKEFGWPAVATAAYHIGIIIGAIVGSVIGEKYLGQYGIAVGVIFGALGEIGLLLPGLHKQHLRYMFVLDLKHPAVRRIARLYAPVALSFLVSAFFAFLDLSLASNTTTPGNGKENYTAMRQATTLIQFPGGLVATALSVAVLPTLSEHVRAGNLEGFKKTLLLGLRLGLLLMIPAMAGLIVLRTPIMALIFEHGDYVAHNIALDAIALQNYAYQLPFIAIDQLLISAFYARKNTLIPVLVGFVSFSGYLAVALPFWR